ncbi:hypothetical protein BCR36DRAFT_587204 [Piromyces finnis]|uniref:Ankyrin n=1 Tax=Piromyces finnis TaxID=1754191 RepID=A0A1Y1UXG3_9FUNG|nr:hypothetical protein BCR36DRAFT_587204 [Piromyces finnis]|eukprot:ORX42387.1 hypothetical protein BCR36DRAFT_587204 [Piromyces finnis]
MCNLSQKRSIVAGWIKNHNFIDLQNYVTKNKINLKQLNKSKFDLLVLAIDSNAPINLIKYILQECRYPTLNYYLNYRCQKENNQQQLHYPNFNVSPLSLALLKNNYDVADLLLQHHADINFEIDNNDLYYTLYHHPTQSNSMTTITTFQYILKNGIHSPSPSFISTLIKNFHNELLEMLIKHFNLSRRMILQLLSFYKYQQTLTAKQLDTLLKNTIDFTEDMYNDAITLANDKALKILISYDTKNRYQINYTLLKYATQYPTDHFITAIQNGSLTLPFNTEKILDNLRHMEEKKIRIRELVGQNDVHSLQQFITRNEFPLLLCCHDATPNKIKKEDILMYAIKNQSSYDMIQFILKHYYSTSLNYTLGSSQSPLLEALTQSRFDVAKLLIRKGADINYKVFFNDRILYYLYYRHLTPRQLIFCIKHGAVLFDDAFDVVQKFIENSQNHLLNLLFKQCIFNNDAIYHLLLLYKNKTKLNRKQLKWFLNKKKGNLSVKKRWYKIANQKQNDQALKILSENDFTF